MLKQFMRTLCAVVTVVAAVDVLAVECPAGTSAFTDVPDSASYCTNTLWLKNRAITTGCTATTYCPDQVVTRGAMALFMNRLGVALTPAVIYKEGSVTPFNPDTAAHVCQTTDITVTGFPRTITATSALSLQVDAYARLLNNIQISFDSGATWTVIPDGANSAAMRNQGTDANDWMDIPNVGTTTVEVGQTFRLGLLIARDNLVTTPVGAGQVIAGRCKISGLLLNRNPATAPY